LPPAPGFDKKARKGFNMENTSAVAASPGLMTGAAEGGHRTGGTFRFKIE
jgi:hypothetical protein